MHAPHRPRANDLDNLKAYKYEPLIGNQALRILEVFAGRPTDDRITCRLLHKNNAKDEEHGERNGRPMCGYEALSWCWGSGTSNVSPDQSISILVGVRSYHFPVYEHLYDALIALRDPEYSRFLWIDAICINQSDLKERAQQVSRMSEVYGEASNVCIWLGKSTPESIKALEFVRDVLQVHRFDELCTDNKYIESWTALLDLMKRPWFSRRWVVQEISLARQATVHCGSASVDWQQFAAAVSLFVDVDTSAKKLSELAKNDPILRHADDFFREVPALGATRLVDTTNRLFKRSVGGLPQRTTALEDIVARLATFETTEPRDTVYALLALAQDSQPSVEGIPDHIGSEPLTEGQKRALRTIARLLPNPYRQSYIVNYKQPIVDVYQQFIAFAMTRSDPTRALDIICRPFAKTFTRKQDVNYDNDLMKRLVPATEDDDVPLPSWIPNVSEVPFEKQSEHSGNDSTLSEHFIMKRLRGDPFVSTPDAVSYSAAGAKAYNRNKVRFRKRQDHYSMFVEGFVLDTIPIGGVDPASQLGNIPPSWLQRGEQHMIEQKDRDAFWKTLVADRSPKGNAPLFYKEVIEYALSKAPKSGGFDTAAEIRKRTSEIISDVLRQVEATIMSRTLFETERKFLGLGPAKALPGDLVCILYGCTVPVLLRRSKKEPVQMMQEQEEDERDRIKRQDRIIHLLKKLLEKRKRKRAAQNTVPAGMPHSRRDEMLLQRSTLRVAFFTLLALIAAFGLGEHLAVGMLILIVVSQSPFRNRVVVATTSQIAVIITTAKGWESMITTSFLLAMFDAIFPEVSLISMEHEYSLVMTRLVRWLPARLRNQITYFLQQGPQDSGKSPSPQKKHSSRKPFNVPDEPPQEYYYQLIGECYVHKMMNGEAILWQNDSVHNEAGVNRVKAEIFELR